MNNAQEEGRPSKAFGLDDSLMHIETYQAAICGMNYARAAR